MSQSERSIIFNNKLSTDGLRLLRALLPFEGGTTSDQYSRSFDEMLKLNFEGQC